MTGSWRTTEQCTILTTYPSNVQSQFCIVCCAPAMFAFWETTASQHVLKSGQKSFVGQKRYLHNKELWFLFRFASTRWATLLLQMLLSSILTQSHCTNVHIIRLLYYVFQNLTKTLRNDSSHKKNLLFHQSLFCWPIKITRKNVLIYAMSTKWRFIIIWRKKKLLLI